MNASLDLAGEVSGDDVLRLSAEDEGRRFGCRILDVRDAAGNHLPGSAQIPVEGETLLAHELPAHLMPSRHHAFVVVAETPILSRHVAVSLRGRGYRAGSCVDGIPRPALRPGPARGELWSPDAFLAACLEHLPPPAAGRVLELGAGSGRDGVFLASHGYDCLLVDRHAEALDMAHERAARQHVRVETSTLDLRDTSPLPEGGFALLTSIRFLRRNVLASAGRLLAPGGMLLLHTFTGDPEKLTGPPRRAHLRFQPRELSSFFPESAWRRVRGPVIEERADNAWIGVLLEKTGR